jgi:hypothetical protein
MCTVYVERDILPPATTTASFFFFLMKNFIYNFLSFITFDIRYLNFKTCQFRVFIHYKNLSIQPRGYSSRYYSHVEYKNMSLNDLATWPTDLTARWPRGIWARGHVATCQKPRGLLATCTYSMWPHGHVAIWPRVSYTHG